MGSCPQGSKCRLYHPKKGKGKKRKTPKDQRNCRGRYFGSGLATSSEPEVDMTEKIITQKNGVAETQGELGDFISLDVSDDELGENDDPTMEPMNSLADGQVVNSELDDLDELILPLRILDRH
uniref:C3H1-type domain-containing protein n=1 Tax=Opuntia streptacantha TaxID=393608 RepID=A0A7C9AJT6_OPUST